VIEIASHNPVPRRSRVLVADDTESIRVLFRKLLATDGHEVIDVGDGEAALAAVHENHPDVVLLDITMPQLDGLQTLHAIRALLPGVPVVLSSGYHDASTLLPGEAPADGFVKKPYRLDELREAVRAALGE
jgi:CheY-like chemotaxis protein